MTEYPRIKDLRKDRDLKQKEVAALLNCSQVSYSYYEIGKREIPVATLIRLAEIHNCSIDYLLGLTDERKPYPRRK